MNVGPLLIRRYLSSNCPNVSYNLDIAFICYINLIELLNQLFWELIFTGFLLKKGCIYLMNKILNLQNNMNFN